VEIRVLRRGNGDAWRVLAGGREITVKFNGTLAPGALLRGFFVPRGGRTEFVLLRDAAGLQGTRGRLIETHTVPPADLARSALLRTFLHASFPLPGPEKLGKLLRLAEKPSASETVKRSALAARCEMKGLSLPEEDFDLLYGLVEGFFRDGGGGRGDKGKEKHQETSDPEKLPVHAVDEENSPLPFFNHVAEGERTWIVIPYACAMEGEEYAGSLRLLYDRESGKTGAAVLSVRPRDGDAVWYFQWRTDGGAMRVYAGGKASAGAKNLPDLARKIRKHGLVPDDILYKEEYFDGFDGVPGQLKIVDELV
jgi:hypothetical protein